MFLAEHRRPSFLYPLPALKAGLFFASGASSRSGKIFLTTASAIAALPRRDGRTLLDSLAQVFFDDRIVRLLGKFPVRGRLAS